MEILRSSVRQLVEFSLPGEDLVFLSSTLKAMADGTLAHKGRQQAYPPGWEKEVSLSLAVDKAFATFIISGRMDGFLPDDTCPVVDEIKLFSTSPLPTKAQEVHLAQGLCYGHILCQTQGYTQVKVQVTYVDISGHMLAQFSDVYSASFLLQQFNRYLDPFVHWEQQRILHEEKRNQTIAALAFPFSDYRPGQREMAMQVYTAIKEKKRLLASLPTGTGKSAAVLFPAIKSLGLGHTKQLFYLTARNTGKESPLKVISLFQNQPLAFRTLTLTAKEKICPQTPPLSCMTCPMAKGFFLRLPQALNAFLSFYSWTEEAISSLCEEHQVCPFETSLALSEIADLVICDYNYAFDPSVRIARIFERKSALTLLVDEAHHLPDRTRDMLSGSLDARHIKAFRTSLGKALGRKHPCYSLSSTLISNVRAFVSAPNRQDFLFHTLLPCAEALFENLRLLDFTHQQALAPLYADLTGELYRFIEAGKRPFENYSLLYTPGGKEGKEGELLLFATDVKDHLAAVTKKLLGVVYFSATLTPLVPMGQLMGADEDDGYFSLPSPFPKQHLLVLRKNVDTRYQARNQTAQAVAKTIIDTYFAHPGKYIVYFPSFAYLSFIYEHLLALDPSLPYMPQTAAMADDLREDFINCFLQGCGPVLGLCVLGGIFAEGIDLPGSALIGTIIVGVGLPMVNPKQEALRTTLGNHFGNGFAFAYQYPGMQKVLQAAGRVIRSEKDYGVVVLIDSRYFQNAYVSLCPDHWEFNRQSLETFWSQKSKHLI